MTATITKSEQIAPIAEERGESPRIDLLGRIALIDRSDLTPRERAAELLDAIMSEFAALAATVSFGLAGDEIEAERVADRSGLDAWAGTLRNAALEARSHSRSIARLYGKDADSPNYAVIACPIDAAGRDPFGGIGMLVPCRSVAEAERIQLHARSACLQAALALAKPVKSRRDVDMNDVARVFARAGECDSLHHFAYAIANALRMRFNCDLAAVGGVNKGKIRLLCISGLDQVKRRNPGVHLIEQAMGECCDAAGPIAAQQQDAWSSENPAERGKLHERWRASCNGASVLSVPVMSGERIAALVSFRRSIDQPFDLDDIEAVEKLIAPLGGALPLVASSTRTLPVHAARSLRTAIGWALKTGSLRKRVTLLALLGMSAWWVTGNSPYRISTPATVVADRERIIASSLDGRIAEVLVRSGEHIEEGHPIVQLDTTDLEFERDELAAEIVAADLRMISAVALGDPAEAAIARAERNAATTRHHAVLDRIARASIGAPVSGIVIGPMLADFAGQQVGVGQVFCSIAERGALSIELRIPESRVDDLQNGGPIRFASHARPESPVRTTLGRVAPAAVQRVGKSVFVGEASLPEELDWLRPGMEGVAIVEVGDRPNWWLATHRLIDTARVRHWIN